MRLYDYMRSTAAYRVRIALNLKQLTYQSLPVSLVHDAQHSAEYINVNPAGLVPSLQIGGGVITQSLAIIEYLEEQYPEPALYPADPIRKAECRAFALDIACDIHPLNNLRVLKHLTSTLGHSEREKLAWYHHWLKEGFTAIEIKLAQGDSPFCFGSEPTMADVCIVPQLFNARRFEFDLTPYPRMVEIEQNCLALAAFANASPEKSV
ncbi:maleylacetoacetate isomerase [Photobacterium sp. 1_MG-2023]|uniref:maleylacetoacetate isomerase n=1 Tax=Photobacterium sp. 1_MG-2023 TaxID=3062646 RepID=UPI0026E2532F|nr:maleylacetoacetate isomerase [Photobacterium sp. 1_MG-2023]MDO6708335.1 maleylacetoacetate isomerase [Photobacterium sp. 1_MG-2023]